MKSRKNIRGKGLLLSLSLVFGAVGLFADEVAVTHSYRSASENIKSEGIETIFYNKGLVDGTEEGRRLGYADAMKDAEASIMRYKNYIKALEAGKYISKIGRITPPRIYQEPLPDGRISVVVKGCNIEGELSPSDILLFPKYERGAEGKKRTTISPSQKSSSVSDSVYLAGVDRKKSLPRSSNTYKKVTFKVFENNSFYRKLFRKSGLVFSLQPNNQIRVMFRSNEEADGFIARHGLTEGKDYR